MKLFSNKLLSMVLVALTANIFSSEIELFQQCSQKFGHVLLAPLVQFPSREAREVTYDVMESGYSTNNQQSPDQKLFGQVCIFDTYGFIKECFGITQQDFFTLARSTGKDFSTGMGYLPPENFCETGTGMENYERAVAVVGGIALGAVITWGRVPLYRWVEKMCTRKQDPIDQAQENV